MKIKRTYFYLLFIYYFLRGGGQNFLSKVEVASNTEMGGGGRKLCEEFQYFQEIML